MAQSKTTIVAVPSSADSFTDLTAIVVPAGHSAIKQVKVSVTPDWGTTAGSVRMAPIFRLQGSGLEEQNPHFFMASFGGHAEVTTGGIHHEQLEEVYDVDIPVKENGTINIAVATLDEAITAGTCRCELMFGQDTPQIKNSQSDYVDSAGTTTADSYAAVGTLTVPVGKDDRQPKRIVQVDMGVAVDQGTSAVSLRCSSRFKMSGSGLGEGGDHEFLGPAAYSGEIGSTPSQGINHSKCIVHERVNIPVNAGGQILVEHQFDVETPTASTVAVGVHYRG